jgi:hypothetical protein
MRRSRSINERGWICFGACFSRAEAAVIDVRPPGRIITSVLLGGELLFATFEPDQDFPIPNRV